MSQKVRLVVASGVHQGKEIPIPGQQFVIGRDPSCQLRPASQLVSKQHCAILVQEGKVLLKDFGSTNGTFLNDKQVEANATIELTVGDRVRVGPLDFSVQFQTTKVSDSTPVPEQLKAVSSAVAQELKKAAGGSSSTNLPSPAKKLSDSFVKPTTAKEADDIAALLLGEDDGPVTSVPEGSTIMEMPAVVADAAKTEAEKKKGAIPSREDSSNAANEILKKMMRRNR